jgi:hypothetical protein
MKIIITEEQYSLYLKRRYLCLRDYVDQLKRGEEKIPVPSTSFEWSTYQYVVVAFLRGYCSKQYDVVFDEDIHNDIMNMFGDELIEIYKMNK